MEPINIHLRCADQVHCSTCTVDPAWRASVESFYGMRITCPLGKVLQGQTPDPPSVPPRPAPTPRQPAAPPTPEQAQEQAERVKAAQEQQAVKEAAALPSAWGRVARGSVGMAKVMLGIDRSPEALISHRRAICEACPHMKNAKCDLCGCYYAQKVKLASETCPDQPPRW